MALTVEQVAALAPDAAALAAGRKLAGGGEWSALGRSDAALWGECKGSALYQVRVDLKDLSTKCSCPSRKFPCKHALGLLFLAVERPRALAASATPDWVTDWLTKRTESAVRKEKRKAEPEAPPDPEAQAKRAEKRHGRVLEGIKALDLWMCDLVRTGLASLEANGPAAFEAQAARMVDAQAPGVAARLRRLAGIPGAGDGWPDRLLPELGRVSLLSHAYRRLDALDDALRADVRALVGFTTEKETVASDGERVADTWSVVGQETADEERVRVQRSWLFGARTGRWALVLQFAAGPAAFPETFVPGTAFDAELAYWPGAFPQRALVRERRGGAQPFRGPMPGARDVAGLLDAVADALARQPWLDAFPASLCGVRPALDGATWSVIDGTGAALPLATREPWRLLALSGGHPVDLAGEWDGRALRPLGLIADGNFEPLGGAA